MRGKKPVQCAGFAFLQRLKFFKESDHRGGIVTRFIHVLNAKVIGLSLKGPRKLEHRHRQPGADSLPDDSSQSARNKDAAGHLQYAKQLRAGGAAAAMSRGNM